jgi:hypothetical protein
MSLRHLVYGALTTTPAWTALIPVPRLIDSDALGIVNAIQPPFPFAVLKGGLESPTPSRFTRSQLFDLWVYDKPGDYNRIHKILDVAMDTLHKRGGGSVTVEGVKWSLMGINFVGASQDFRDDMLRATTRYATYRVVGNKQ